VAAVALGLLVGCSASAPTTTPAATTSSAADSCGTQGDARTYGCGPATDGTIAYQPDVILVGAGAAAIRAAAPDGVTWTLDATAPGVDRMEVGKVAYVTDVAVGRVVAVTRDGGDVRVTLGPVGLGEVVLDGDLRWSRPLTSDDVTPAVAPELRGVVTEEQAGPASSGRATDSAVGSVAALRGVELAAYRPSATGGLAATEDAPVLEVFVGEDEEFGMLCCKDRLGALFSLERTGIRLRGGMWLRLQNPSIDGHAKVRNGEVVDAAIEVEGVQGLHVEFEAASTRGPAPQNFDTRYLPPVDFVYRVKGGPRGGPAFKVAWQAFRIRTAFSAGSSTLVGSADYDFNTTTVHAEGSERAGVVRVSLPTDFKTKTSLLDSLTGVSVGVNGLILSMINHICLCYGRMAFSNGVYVQLESTIGVTNDSSAVAILGARCRSVVYDSSATVGGGHHLWQGFVDQWNADQQLTGDDQVAADVGYSQAVTMWDRVASFPVGIRRCT